MNAVLAGFSFSLYVTHVPVIALLRSRFSPWPLDPQSTTGILSYVACAAVCVAVAWLFSLVTERHVHAWRRQLVAWLSLAPSR